MNSSPSRRQFAHLLTPPPSMVVVISVVLCFHAVGLLGWHFNQHDEALRQRPDLTIEFFTPAPVASKVPVVQAGTPAVKHTKPQTKSPVKAQPTEPEPQANTATVPAPSAPENQTVDPTATIQTQAPVATEPASLPMANTEADYKAAYLNNPRPPYPLSAVRQGAEGRVVLWAEVLPDGRAGRVSLEKSSGHALLDASAMNTVRSWRFTPARKDGVLTTQAVRIPIDFTLQNQR